jgi:hypothetical protein
MNNSAGNPGMPQPQPGHSFSADVRQAASLSQAFGKGPFRKFPTSWQLVGHLPKMIGPWRQAGRQAVTLFMIWFFVATVLTFPRLSSEGFGPQGDLFTHYYLTNAFARALQDGEWLPRWAGLLDGGRGDAVFTFYAPLFYQVSGGMALLTGLSIFTVFKFLLFSGFILAQFSAWLLAREFFGVRASVITAIAYVALPAYPHLALHRGFLPNALALSLVPLALLGAHRLLSESKYPKGLVLFALSFGALILIHPITTYLSALAVALMVLCYWPQTEWAGIRNLATGVLFALALTAFFVAPQITGMKWVRADLEVTQHDFRNYFLFAESADATPYRQVWAGLNQVVSLMTLAQTALVVVLSLAGYRLLRHSNRAALWWWWLALAGFGLFISLPVSDFLWSYLPGMKFIQFPWRFQPFVALAAGLLAAAAFEGWEKNGKHTRTALAATGTWLALASLAFTFLLVRPQGEQLSRDEIRRLLHPAEARPLTSQQVNELRGRDDLSYLAYAANRIPFRPRGADFTLYPPTDQVGTLSIIAGQGKVVVGELRNSHRRFTLANEEPISVRIETYFHPNWIVRIDGQPVRISVEPGSGLMLIDVPAGAHTLTLDFEISRSIERWARLISLASIVVLMALVRR